MGGKEPLGTKVKAIGSRLPAAGWFRLDAFGFISRNSITMISGLRPLSPLWWLTPPKGGRRRQAAFIMAPPGAHLPSGAVLYNYPGRSPQPVRKAKPIPDRTLGAQGRRPGGAINPRGEAASTFGNTAKRRHLSTKSHRLKYRTQQKSPIFRLGFSS